MHFKNCYSKRGGGGVRFSYAIIFLGGGNFDAHHFSENLRPPLGPNKLTIGPLLAALHFPLETTSLLVLEAVECSAQWAGYAPDVGLNSSLSFPFPQAK